LEGPRKN